MGSLAVVIIGCSSSPGASTSSEAASGDPAPAASTALPAATPSDSPVSPVPSISAPSDAPPSAAPTGSSPASSPSSSISIAPATQVSWQQLDQGDSPPARSDHTWTVDGDGTAAWLFGGTSDASPFEDLWRYDLAADQWRRIEPAGDRPPARFGHVAAWVDGIGLVIWSGQAGDDFFNDLWAFDPTAEAWSRLPDGGAVPAARYGSCGAVGPDGRLWISHGFTDSGRFDDTRAYDFAAGQWTEIVPVGERPIKRCLHDCLWTPDGRFLLYAGQTDGEPALGDLWSLDPTSAAWTRQDRPEPEARQLYALATVDSTAFVFGGADADRRRLDSLFVLDLDAEEWREAEPAGRSPAGRSGAALIADPDRERLLLYGGTGTDETLGDLWQLDPAG
ncbi:hypothetical protein BH24CHL8_BH24CHL8_10010 [soil metagenome]